MSRPPRWSAPARPRWRSRSPPSCRPTARQRRHPTTSACSPCRPPMSWPTTGSRRHRRRPGRQREEQEGRRGAQVPRVLRAAGDGQRLGRGHRLRSAVLRRRGEGRPRPQVVSALLSGNKAVPFMDQRWPNAEVQPTHFAVVQELLGGKTTVDGALKKMDEAYRKTRDGGHLATGRRPPGAGEAGTPGRPDRAALVVRGPGPAGLRVGDALPEHRRSGLCLHDWSGVGEHRSFVAWRTSRNYCTTTRRSARSATPCC